MIINDTPLEHYPDLGLWVKREDLCCPPPGPPFSKTRGVFRHIERRPEKVIGVLDTYHSQAGHAVARACEILGKKCINFYPVYKKDEGRNSLFPQQQAAVNLGAELRPLKAGMSAVLWNIARRELPPGAYMMPNALKLPESVTETAAEFERTAIPPECDQILVAVSSGTIGAGVILGAINAGWTGSIVLHMGYDRSEERLREYIFEKVNRPLPTGIDLILVNEGYSYKDQAKTTDLPPFPCNPYYDLKLYKWWRANGHGKALLWNIG